MSGISSYAELLGIRETTNDRGDPICIMTPSPAIFAREGVMHGGATAALLHYAARSAVTHALSTDGKVAPPVQVVSMTVDYLRPGLMIQNTAAGRIVKLGARVANVVVHAWGEDEGKPFAIAKLTVGISTSETGK